MNSAVTPPLSGAPRMITKTPVEAVKLPTLRDNLEGLQVNFAGVSAAKDETVDEDPGKKKRNKSAPVEIANVSASFCANGFEPGGFVAARKMTR